MLTTHHSHCRIRCDTVLLTKWKRKSRYLRICQKFSKTMQTMAKVVGESSACRNLYTVFICPTRATVRSFGITLPNWEWQFFKGIFNVCILLWSLKYTTYVHIQMTKSFILTFRTVTKHQFEYSKCFYFNTILVVHTVCFTFDSPPKSIIHSSSYYSSSLRILLPCLVRLCATNQCFVWENQTCQAIDANERLQSSAREK